MNITNATSSDRHINNLLDTSIIMPEYKLPGIESVLGEYVPELKGLADTSRAVTELTVESSNPLEILQRIHLCAVDDLLGQYKAAPNALLSTKSSVDEEPRRAINCYHPYKKQCYPTLGGEVTNVLATWVEMGPPMPSHMQSTLEKNPQDAEKMKLIREEAYIRIRKCYIATSEKLDLSNLGLGSLPPIIARLVDCRNGWATHLETLDLSGNRLLWVPGWVFRLENLRVLNLSRNELTLLPEEVGDLKKLEQLNLSGIKNSFTKLPPSIQKLSQLKELDLRKVEKRPSELPLVVAGCKILIG